MAASSLIIISSVVEIVAAVAVFIVASIFESLDKKTWTPSPRLRVCQLTLTSAIIALSITHAGLLAYPQAFVQTEVDPVVACALFVVLTWVVLLLPLIDRKHDAAYPHFIAWAIVLAFEVLNTPFILSSSIEAASTKAWVDCAIVISRLACIVILLAGSLLTKHSRRQRETATPEETRPLLDVESRNADQNTADQKGNPAKEENEYGDDEDEDWKEHLDRLKQRTWTEYVASFKIFLPHLRPKSKSQYLCLAVMMACTGVGRVLNVLIPLSLGWLINSLEGAKALPWQALLQYLGLYFINSSAGTSVVQHLASVRMSMSMRLSLDIFIYDHIMNLDAKFHDCKKTATLGRITDRGDTVIDLFQEFFFDLLPTISDLFISLAVLQWLFGAYVCFIVALTVVVFAWSNALLITNKTSMRRTYVDAWCAFYDHMFETQFNWTTVSHFGRIEHEKNNFRTKSNTKVTEELALTTYSEVTTCTRQMIMTVGFICASLLAANQIVQGHRKVGDFVMLVTYWSQVMSPVNSIIQTITSVSERLVDAEKLVIVLEKKPDVQDTPDAPDFVFKGGSVDFKDVTFSYDGERTVSEGITFHADAGQTIALVGETGGGKSTLLKLLFRFYDPVSGRILVDGQDISSVKIESFRNLVGIVPQDPALFNRTIFENVRYPNTDATEAEVIEACKGACLHDKIMTFSKQYQEKVGERGTKLSGGECQRLAIARAMLKKPKILLLDEATSSVDSVTETKIQACLKQLCQGRTTFVIAHRLSTILHADQIMVIKGGKLLEMGPHRQLIKRKGAYRELWDAQLNMQLQDPADTDKNDDEESDEVEKPAKSSSMFYNDMSKEEINEALLLSGLSDADESGSRPESSRGVQNQITTNSSLVEGEVGSEDVTEVESNSGGDGDNNRKGIPFKSTLI